MAEQNTQEIYQELQDKFESDIAFYLHSFCEKNNIQDMKAEGQNVWTAALMYINKHAFKDKQILKIDKPLMGYKNNNYNNEHGKLNYSTCNAYDIEKVSILLDYYIYLCRLFDKQITLYGFSAISGIDDNTLQDWGKNRRELSTAGKAIYEKIIKERENSLSAKLATGNKNPVGILAILNRYHQWNMPGVTRETAEQLQQKTPEEIRQLYGNQAPAELPEPPKD